MRDEPNDLFVQTRRRGIRLDIRDEAPLIFLVRKILDFRFSCRHCALSNYAWKLEPHPQVLVAFGFLNTNPRPITSSRKSISAFSRYSSERSSHRICTPCDSDCTSVSAGSSSTRSSMYE